MRISRTRTDLVLREKNRRIKELSALISQGVEFKSNGLAEFVEKNANRDLSASSQAEFLRFKLLGGLAIRWAWYEVVRYIMQSIFLIECLRLVLSSTQMFEQHFPDKRKVECMLKWHWWQLLVARSLNLLNILVTLTHVENFNEITRFHKYTCSCERTWSYPQKDYDTAATLVGGVARICAMPNTDPAIVDADWLLLVEKLSKVKARCDYAVFLVASLKNCTSAELKIYFNYIFTTLKLDDSNVWTKHLPTGKKEHHAK